MAEFDPRGLVSENREYDNQGIPIPEIVETVREIPPQTPFQEASILEPDTLYMPIAVERTYVLSDLDAGSQPPVSFGPFGRSVVLAVPAGLLVMVAPTLLVPAKDVHQSVTITSIGTAAQIDIGFLTESVHRFPPALEPVTPAADWQFALVVTVPGGSLPYSLTLPPRRALWGIQFTAIDQTVCLTVGAALVSGGE